MKIGIVIAIFVVCGLVLTPAFGGLAEFYRNNDLPQLPPADLMALSSPPIESWADFLKGLGGVVEHTRKDVTYVRNAEGKLVEIITNVEGELFSGDIVEKIDREIRQLEIPGSGISITIAAAQITVSTFVGEDGESYRQVQMISAVDMGEGFRFEGDNPLDRIVIGYIEDKDGKRQYFGTIQTGIEYEGNEIVSSENMDVTELDEQGARDMAARAWQLENFKYMMTL